MVIGLRGRDSQTLTPSISSLPASRSLRHCSLSSTWFKFIGWVTIYEADRVILVWVFIGLIRVLWITIVIKKYPDYIIRIVEMGAHRHPVTTEQNGFHQLKCKCTGHTGYLGGSESLIPNKLVTLITLTTRSLLTLIMLPNAFIFLNHPNNSNTPNNTNNSNNSAVLGLLHYIFKEWSSETSFNDWNNSVYSFSSACHADF